MSARIISGDFQGQAVTFNSDGWINATEAAARFGKRPVDWLRLEETASYIEAMAGALGLESKVSQNHFGLARTSRGGKYPGTWLHPKLAVRFAQWLDVRFAVWCDLRIEDLLHGGGQNWNSARREASLGYRGLCDALALNCEAQGKTPQRHHFINEARLINEVITGTFAGRDRDRLTAHELEIVTLVELRDSVLIGQGLAYGERKTNLLQYVQQLLSKRIGSHAA
ncbi:KilA-N domain-containing protein [Ectopseudomonas hydrolytica]|uniref:KilA-N domain-containing protein n=1 Tax=Ectopseudomonas hydrolytica TaxID=2493633 RepID=UPI0020B82737|nr:KilA-N domain-containing protein [Pseudomonas hydrolytica]UTH29998.1 KilA-N domain-containing protein [Pseudomonas hydrolytica]